MKVPYKSDAWLYVYLIVSTIQCVAANSFWFKVLWAVITIGLGFVLLRRLTKYRYRSMLQQLRYQAMIAALNDQKVKVLITCPECQQNVADMPEHRRKVHGWSPSPS